MGIKLDTQRGRSSIVSPRDLEKCINSLERDILKIINKQITFRLGASFTIGSYVIPGECLNRISESIGNDVNLSIDVSEKIL